MFFMFHILVIIISIFESVCCTRKIFNQEPSKYLDETFKISSFKDATRNESSPRKPLFHTILKSKNLKSNVFDKMLSDEMFSIKQRFFDQDLAYKSSTKNIFSQTTPHTPTLEVRQKWPLVDLLTKQNENVDQIENKELDSRSNDDLDKTVNETLGSNLNDNLGPIDSEKLDSKLNNHSNKIHIDQLGPKLNHLDKIDSEKFDYRLNDDLDKIDHEKLDVTVNDNIDLIENEKSIGTNNELNTDAKAFDERNLPRSNEVNLLKKNLDVRSLGPNRGVMNHDQIHASTPCSCMRQSQYHSKLRQGIPVTQDSSTTSNTEDCSRTTITYSIMPFYYPYSMYPPFFINDEDPQPQKIYYQPPVINNVKIPKTTKKRKTTKYSEEDLYYDENNSKEDSKEFYDDGSKNILINFDYDVSEKKKPENNFIAELDQVYTANVLKKCYCSSGKIFQSVNIHIYCILSIYFLN